MTSSSHTARRLFLSIFLFCAKHAWTNEKNCFSVPRSAGSSRLGLGLNPTRQDSTLGGGSKHDAVTGLM